MSEQLQSDEGVAAALEAAVAADAATEAAEQAKHLPAPPDAPAESNDPAPVQPTVPVTPAAPEPVVAPAPEAPAVVDTFDGGKFNPDELPAELQPGWNQLQAAFTQKTQELAEQRKQFEELGDPESLQQARELYERIQDPANWKQLHEELEGALRENGLIEPATTEPAPAAPELPDLSELDDPELAPVKAHLERMNAELESFRSERQREKEAQQVEQQQLQLANELTRQENVIRQANPVYEDEDVDMVFQLSQAKSWDMLGAQQQLEGYVQQRLDKYLAAKAAAESATAHVSPPSEGALTTKVAGDEQTLEEVEAEAAEYLRGLVAAGELELP